MIWGILFAFWRILEILTLIPIIGILSYFIHQYIHVNALTPNSILVLFITSVLGAAYALYTLFRYHRSRRNGLFVAFLDLCFVGAFIASVVELRYIDRDNCTSLSTSDNGNSLSFGVLGTINYQGLDLNVNKTCALLKAAWALGIVNTIAFAFTSILALLVGLRTEREEKRRQRGGRSGDRVRETKVVRETHVSRHGHRREGGGSHRSHRSSHSRSRRTYA